MINLFINKINYDLIKIIKYKDLYKILYQLPYVNLIGIPLKIHKCEIINNMGYNFILRLQNKDDINLIQNIETLFALKIKNYSSVMKDNHIYLKYNSKLKDFYSSYIQTSNEYIYLSISGILYQKKYNIHKPLIHLYV